MVSFDRHKRSANLAVSLFNKGSQAFANQLLKRLRVLWAFLRRLRVLWTFTCTIASLRLLKNLLLQEVDDIELALVELALADEIELGRRRHWLRRSRCKSLEILGRRSARHLLKIY
jgi:hypothetical protein